MEKLFDFIYVLSWMFGVTSTLFTALRIIAYFNYSELNKLRDRAKYGVEATFPIKISGIIMILCWTWILIN